MTASRELIAAEPLSTRRQLELMRDLQRLATERAQEESRIASELKEGLRAAEQARSERAADITKQFTARREQASVDYEQVTSAARAEYEKQRDAAQREYKQLRSRVESEVHEATSAASEDKQRVSWEALAVYDALKGQPKQRFEEAIRQINDAGRELAVLERDVVEILQMRRQQRAAQGADTENELVNESVAADDAPVHRAAAREARTQPGAAFDTAMRAALDSTNAVRNAAVTLHQQKLPRLFEGGNLIGAFFVLWLLCGLPLALVLGWQQWQWVPIAAGVALAATAVIGAALWPIARRQTREQYREIQGLLAQARQALALAKDEARVRAQFEAQALVTERDEQLQSAEQVCHEIVSERSSWMEGELARAGRTYPQRLTELRAALDRTLEDAKKKHSATLTQITDERDRHEQENEQHYEARCRDLQARHDAEWQTMADRWRSGIAAVSQSCNAMQRQCERIFPDWDETNYDTWPKPEVPAEAIRFGGVAVDLAQLKHGLSDDPELQPAPSVFQLPALMTLDEHPVLLVTAEDDGRRAAVELLQLVMLRMLTAMPPGKVRFTIFDPVGLGENFASFMHLADFDEQLIASRIWTESRQIEEQLTRLTVHMETVLQKYLRNEFATIHEYNAQAGEVAEPFQVLVVANFPTNFGEAAARKLVSVATSGPRCGVYTLIMVDRKQKLPANFDLQDLAANAVHLDWVTKDTNKFPSGGDVQGSPGYFRWRYPAFEHLPLVLDHPPSAERFNDVVRAAGRAAKDSMKVEVPFAQVAPPEDAYWSKDSSSELVVPIGRAGARRLQPVRLGKGTSQHLLVCGKTGSGKSTFLHALITNTALYYSPDEVEFYLIDFKKGVEFKTYATHRLPHARVIAIESEREFGLSVLERLDQELHRRGDLFRAAGVQDLPAFRHARPDKPMPRILLVIDEFQELFVEDDKLSQDAALLLDRLVRQGRAFGIHVLLGSQTLSGAYSLARSTMGQMAVRVALQCSEADANLILSDERNMAARFLSRPGEAIYNDQNGLVAGNSPFQVVWLPESQRIEYLRSIDQRAETVAGNGKGDAQKSLIVFEGDQPADPADNSQLRHVLERADWSSTASSAAQKAWLGAAVAIKEPTAATFARHAGSNLLVVGAWEESALGVLSNALVALVAQNRQLSQDQEGSPQFYILDGTRAESPEAGAWQTIAAALPQEIRVGGPRDTSQFVNDISAELARRESSSDETAPPIYLFVFNGGRFRELRRQEDDFSFSMDRDKTPTPDKQWAEILRNGPAWGIHSLVWCDSYNNVNRLLDRVMLREFEMRVAFQMSAADSSSLLDTPAAARLRQHRGLFASEDVGTLEKFRPYAIPTSEWLDRVRTWLTSSPRLAL